VVRGGGIAGLGYALTQGLNLAAYLVLAHVASPEDFGIYAAGSVLVELGQIFAGSGIQAALIARQDRLEEAANTAVLSSLAAGALLSLVAAALSPVVGAFFDSGDIAAVAAVMSGAVVLRNAKLVPDALMQRNFSFLRRVVVDPAAVVVFGSVSIFACARGAGAWGLVAGTYAAGTTRLILSWTLARWRPRPRRASFAMWLELAAFGRYVLVSEAIRRATVQLPIVLVGRFLGTDPLGQYRYADRLGTQPQAAITDVASYVLFPAFVRIAPDRERLRRAFIRAVGWLSVLSMPAGFFLFPFGEPIATLILGEEWRSAGYAMMAMCGYTGARSLASVASEAFKATGRPEFLPRMHLISIGLTAVTMVALLPLGLTGVGAALSIASIGVAYYAISSACRIIEIGKIRVLQEVWPPAVAAAIVAALLYGVDRAVLDVGAQETLLGLSGLALLGLAGTAGYLALLAVIAPRKVRTLLTAVRVRGVGLRRRQAVVDGEDAERRQASLSEG
jgi:O-antigen/teichoic acid export membrane protein